MKKTSPVGTIVIFLIIILPLAYAASIYSALPATIPIHFSLSGKVDRYGDKNNIWFVSILLASVSAATYLLVKNLPRIDPKKMAGQSPQLFHKIAVVIVIFLCALNLLLIYSMQSGSINIGNLLLPLLGLMFLVLGNYMHSVKPNYFVGFRVPWTLENEDNWRKTHQLMGKVWVAGGLLITIATLLLPANFGFFVFMGIIFIMVTVPAVFSYRYFKKHQQS
jgi:uncharacterized membrane protein